MVMSRSRVAGAPLAMRKRGETTDALVLRKVELRPGSSVHDIAERLDWTNGRVDGSVNRLISQGKVRVRHVLRKGTLVKEVYPKEYVSKPHDVVEIPRNMIADDLWKETVEVYALSRTTIAISPDKVEEWDKRAFRQEQVSIQKSDKALEIRLPGSIADFYQLENSEISLSTVGNLALVTVESTLVPVALPATYPAEAMYRK
jgi:predicted transcriptional regulator